MNEAERRELERVVRLWLLQKPRPASLVLAVGDERRAMALPPNAVWASVASTVVRMAPDSFEALDDKGAILRVTDFAELTGSDDELDTPRPTTPAPPAAPDMVVPPDPESQRFALVANLLAQAYRHGTHVAFERLAAMAERADSRAAGLERAIETQYRTERMRLERMARELEEREVEIEEERDVEGNGAIDKIVAHVAKHVGGVDDDDDDAPPAEPQANGKAH